MNFKLICVICPILLVVNELNAKELDSRISGGALTALWRERFAVRIISAVNEGAPQGYLSTGVAVTQQHVVTVAQAISGFSIWRIGYGHTIVEQHFEVICRNAVAHPEFNSTLFHNNVGVIHVPYVLPNWFYSPIGFSSTEWINLVSGYGLIANDQLATELQVATIVPLPLSTCSQFFGEEFLRDDNLCFSNGNVGPQIRNGDQGGPAFFNAVDTPTFGIISFWGLTPDSPFVLIDLQEHQSFLEMQFAIAF